MENDQENPGTFKCVLLWFKYFFPFLMTDKNRLYTTIFNTAPTFYFGNFQMHRS